MISQCHSPNLVYFLLFFNPIDKPERKFLFFGTVIDWLDPLNRSPVSYADHSSFCPMVSFPLCPWLSLNQIPQALFPALIDLSYKAPPETPAAASANRSSFSQKALPPLQYGSGKLLQSAYS